ncbi:glycoside hydrolase family 73 protein [Fructobacillus fructosus]|uniref:Flagellum-specific peptidoglycan hydrolase FlgJ (FlgJ) n=1 Tax=Fructobacillus fructosus TaxID=1631 RepID=A0ABM9MUL3_9LACO|nr:glycoside hydrolase family 73 protein [Fructobacillus fructosus]MBD9365004.1 glycoside hydrolase family 73 protein [Leuconostoc mesenteroides]MBC9118527.1 glycoside hydrolase family 73 protein [Fructobacillus fructosus]MCK8638441.1 glycoside hydrolase family 73 protein [Fructobacillus fructosus]CAK1223130.1 Flagellum-specific peptidoglycan hydrolase FlgJ (FlgJ) [Fructobacillus fructosus]CAK1223176.1 Flagellum-specific peptidoglycan hydrolase FlgJ (FlgJ) [Fructobacillus fructosus]
MAKRKRHVWLKLPKNKKARRRYYFVITFFLFLLVAAACMTPQFLANRQEARLEDQRSQQLKNWAPYAQQLQKQYGIFSSISLAQAALESDFGQSELAVKAHNLYGVKASSGQSSVTMPTKEYQDGSWVTVDASFVAYPSWQASMLAHAQLLRQGTSWNKGQYAHVLAAKSYQAAAQGLVTDGYATDPDYAVKLVQVIEKYHLQRFDLVN